MFQWTARFPLLALDVERGLLDSASEHARFMLGESQQRLLEEVRLALVEALDAGTRASFERAVQVARACGYT